MTATVTKLVKADFDQTNRFRKSRARRAAARCELCVHAQNGCCNHQGRRRRILLSRAPLLRGGEREDLHENHICDRIEIPCPPTIQIPDLEKGYGVRAWPGKLSRVGTFCLLHSNPRCAYILAKLIDEDGKDLNAEGFEVRNFSEWMNASPYLLCELCGSGLSWIKQGMRDSYLQSQGFDDGYTYEPPKRPTIFDDGPYEVAEFTLETELSNWGAHADWTEEKAIEAVKFGKKLMQHPGLQYKPRTKTYTGFPGQHWGHLAIILRALGWDQIVDRIEFEMATREQQKLYCIHCSLTRDQCGPTENPVRIGSRPHCPVCGQGLVDSHTHHDAMPE